MNQPPDELGLGARALLLASEAWALLTRPSTLLGLLAGTAAALGLSFWVSSGGGEVWRELSGAENPLLARFDALLGLHAPWGAWWLVVLGVAAVVSLTALLLERSPWWALRPAARDALPRRKLPELDAERVRAAAACLGESVKVAEGSGGLALQTLSSLHRIAVPALVAGALLLSLGIVLAVRGAILGEMILAPDQPAQQVQTPGRQGQMGSRMLPFTLDVLEVSPSGERAQVVPPGGDPAAPVELTPNAPLRIGTTWIEPRFTRQADGGERFRIRLVGPDEATEEALLVPREALQLEGSDSSYRVMDYTEDLNAAGPAAWVERLVDDAPVEAFWVFQRVPAFDGPNRDDPIAVQLLGIQRQHQLVAGVVHLEGLWALVAGLALFLVGVVLLLLAVRGSRVVGFDGEEAWGYPAGDAGVGKALDALATGSGS